MTRTPEQCDFRESIVLEDQQEVHCCNLARSVVGIRDKTACRVRRDVCIACCTRWQPGPGAVNAVVASLVCEAASSVLSDPNASSRTRQEAERALQYALPRTELVSGQSTESGDAQRQLGAGGGTEERATPAGAASAPAKRLQWATGLLTAPRPKPTIRQTLLSLQAAGFESPQIFAEPGSCIPDEFCGLPVTFHGRALGNLGNFLVALWSLRVTQPFADCYAIFEDDIEVATGLREWCDGQFWPQGVGLVSLYTSRIYADDVVGWRVLKLGSSRTFGSLAFVFRRDVLGQFLTDGRPLGLRNVMTHGCDSAVGEWATRRGIGIAYHTPSLVQHVGTTTAIGAPGHGIGRASKAEAVASVAAISQWRPPKREFGRIGLVGWNTATGLGYQNRDIATHLPIEKWLVPIRQSFRTLPAPGCECHIERVPVKLSHQKLKAWLHGLDWVLFVEQPYIQSLPQCARELDISVAFVPNWEYANLESAWMKYVDLMICPTKLTYDLIADWRSRFGFVWDVVHVPWPVDTCRFQFRQRSRCRTVLFVNGTGGTPARRDDGSVTPYRRKGLDVVLQAARSLPQIPFLVYTQRRDTPPLPGNVTLRKAPCRNDQLYLEGDICVQPSYWEGLGLQLLECQSAGLPLVTTDAPPMNEYQPMRAIPVAETEIVSVADRHPITSAKADPGELATILDELYQSDISEASAKAREFVEREHSWDRALHMLKPRMCQ